MHIGINYIYMQCEDQSQDDNIYHIYPVGGILPLN